MQFTKQLSKRINVLKQERQLNISELSRKSGVSRHTISRLLKG